MEWVYDNQATDPYELKIQKFLKKALKNDDLATKSARTLGLYKFLRDHKFQSSDELFNAVYLDKDKKQRFFSRKDAKRVYKLLAQNGGDEGMKPYDKIVWRWLQFMYEFSPDQIKQVIDFTEPFAFPLHTVEEDVPGFGQSIGFAVDMAQELNKNIAKSLQVYTPQVLGFAPIPEASTVGIVLGYIFSTFFIFMNMALFVARKDLGQAFTQSFALIPFIGTALQNASESGDRLLEKFSKKRGKFIDQVRGVFPGLADFLNMVFFDPNYSGDPKADAEYWKGKIGEHAESVKNSINTLKESVSSPEKRAELMAKAQTKGQELHNRALETVGNLQNKAKEQIENIKTKATQAVNQAKSPTAMGGFSKIKNKKGKWRTQRKLKK